jgi:hypothetical protein
MAICESAWRFADQHGDLRISTAICKSARAFFNALIPKSMPEWDDF